MAHCKNCQLCMTRIPVLHSYQCCDANYKEWQLSIINDSFYLKDSFLVFCLVGTCVMTTSYCTMFLFTNACSCLWGFNSADLQYSWVFLNIYHKSKGICSFYSGNTSTVWLLSWYWAHDKMQWQTFPATPQSATVQFNGCFPINCCMLFLVVFYWTAWTQVHGCVAKPLVTNQIYLKANTWVGLNWYQKGHASSHISFPNVLR